MRPFFIALITTIVGISASKASAQVEFLEQNWTPEVRQAFYTTSQGSRIMPYAWFLALEVSDSTESFVHSRLNQLGYLPNGNMTNNPDKLPVGFVKDVNEITKKEFIGLNCAACHTNQLTYKGKTFQIDGAPTLADMWGMLDGLDQSLQATRDSNEKFARFANKVLGAESSNVGKVNELKNDLAEFLVYWSNFVEDSRTQHGWGRGRLDAFGMIFNRVSSIDLQIPSNSRKPDAPVSYPFLWGTSFQSRVQWNGVAVNTNDIERLGRNVGEVLGVFAEAQFKSTPVLGLPRPARTSAKRLNQVRLENHLKNLWSPKWPSELGAIDSAKSSAGRILYESHCVRCHEIIPRGVQTFVEVEMTPLSDVRTDPKMATNAAVGEVSTGDLKSLFGGRSKVPRGELLQTLVQFAVASPYRDVSAHSSGLLDKLLTDDVFSAEEINGFLHEIRFAKSAAQKLLEDYGAKSQDYYRELYEIISSTKSNSDGAAAPQGLKYKAAPLAGIWATAPYLHNGSVPNLYELLLPAEKRSTSFYVGQREFDPIKVGFECTQAGNTTLFNTLLPGNSNAGHDTYGSFTEEQRWQLIEFLKTL